MARKDRSFRNERVFLPAIPRSPFVVDQPDAPRFLRVFKKRRGPRRPHPIPCNHVVRPGCGRRPDQRARRWQHSVRLGLEKPLLSSAFSTSTASLPRCQEMRLTFRSVHKLNETLVAVAERCTVFEDPRHVHTRGCDRSCRPRVANIRGLQPRCCLRLPQRRALTHPRLCTGPALW
jgi:hypothetical protein|eukprot:COSAG06_NODE_29_length_31823_cov_17.447106_3_plen_176_part_00